MEGGGGAGRARAAADPAPAPRRSCYAKCIGLKAAQEPEIHAAIRFGAVLENVVFDEHTRTVAFDSNAVTENTRASYPIEHINNARIPCVAGHPKHLVLLCCDAFGVLPPVGGEERGGEMGRPTPPTTHPPPTPPPSTARSRA